MNELYPGENRDVIDPWSGPESGYHEAFDIISRACTAIIENNNSEMNFNNKIQASKKI